MIDRLTLTDCTGRMAGGFDLPHTTRIRDEGILSENQV